MPATPFSFGLEPYIEQLPLTFREQFLLAPDAGYQVKFEGQMERIWHRPRWLWPFFYALAWADMLFPEVGENVPATMVIAAGFDTNGQPYQTWQRTFEFTTPRRFNAVMAYDSTRNRVVEWMGPAKLLQITWEVAFDPPRIMRITTHKVAIRLGRWSLVVPRWASMTVHAIERAKADDIIHINLTVSHPWLGAIFGYEGSFRMSRQPYPQTTVYAD